MPAAQFSITIPPGKLGIHLEDFRSDVSSTVVSSINAGSPLAGKVFEGDCMVCVNGVDVHKMDTSHIFEVFQHYSQQQKVITFVRTNPHEIEDATLETESLSMNSDPMESIASSCNERTHDRSHHRRHHRHSSQNNSVMPLAETTQKHHHHHKKNKHKSPISQANNVTIEIMKDDSGDDRPQQFDAASNKPRNKKKSIVPIGPTVITNNDEESPLPTYVFDTSTSEASSQKQKLSSTTSGLTEDYSFNSAPTPVSFVFDDSIPNKSFTKNKLYEAPSPNQTAAPPPTTPHGPGEDASLATSLPKNEWNHYSSEAQTRAEGQPLSEARSFSRSSSSYSSDSSESTVQGRAQDQYEIVADAVLVDDNPEIYDAECIDRESSSNEEQRAPKIDINLYPPPEGESRGKSQGCCDSKFCFPITILLAIIVGAGFIILGIVLGMKKSGSNNTVTTNNVDSTTANSQLAVDDHSQTSNIFYNSATNHYFFQYQNGTAADMGSTPPVVVDQSQVSSMFLNLTTNHVTVEYKNGTVSDVGPVDPLYLDIVALYEEPTTSTSTTQTTWTDPPMTPSSNLFGEEVESIATTTTPSTSFVMATSAQTTQISTTPLVTTIPATTEVIDATTASSLSEVISSTAPTELATAVSSVVHVSGNDKCEHAISLKDLPAYHAGSTRFATPDFTSNLEETCGTSLESKGVWYSLPSDKRRIVRLEFELKLQGLGDSVLSIFTGSCGAGLLSCKDNKVGADDNWGDYNGVATYEFLTEVGETYLFLLSGEFGDTAGEYEFRVFEYDIPSNDACEAAMSIGDTVPGVPKILNGTTLGSTPDFTDSNVGIYACDGMDWYTRGLWYKLTGKGTNIRLEYHVYLRGLGNSELSIFTGSCGDLECVQNEEGADDDWGDYNDIAAYEFFAAKDQTYLFLLYGETFDTAGTYEFKVTEYEVPSNDECAKATDIGVSSAISFVKKDLSTLGATPDFTEFSSDTCEVAWYTRGVWYSLVGHGAVVRLEYQLYSKGWGNSELSIFTGSCETPTCYQRIEGDYDGWGGYNDIVNYEFIPDDEQQYLIWLSGENFNAAATYDFSVSEYAVPSNDKCEDAVSFSPGSLYPGTTAGATLDFDEFNPQTECGGTGWNRGVWYSFTGNGKLTFISFTPSYEDALLALFSGSCGDSLICEGNYGTGTSFGFVPVNGKEYRLFLAGSSFDAAGDYSLLMEQYERPPNDDCTSAVKIASFPYNGEGNMKGASPDFTENNTLQCGDVDYSGVWYSFTGTGKTISLELKTAGTASDYWGEIAVFQGQCGQFECIIQKESEGANAIVTVSLPSTIGAQYKVLVASYELPTYDVSFRFSASEQSV